MTNEIEKAARAVVEAYDNINSLDDKENVRPMEKVDASIMLEKATYNMLEKAIYNLRRAFKPTKEECIAYFQAETLFTADDETPNLEACDDNVINATIEYLQESQKGVWIENTGVNPNLADCKLIIQYGGCDNCAELKEVQSCDLREVDWVEWCPEDRIYKYMIIE